MDSQRSPARLPREIIIRSDSGDSRRIGHAMIYRALCRGLRRIMRPVRSFCAAALVLVAGTVGCTSSAGSSAIVGNPDYPGSSAPPASPIPVRTGLYERIPPACSTVDTATLRAIAPGIGAGSEKDVSGSEGAGDGIVQRNCLWGQASGPGWTRTGLVFIVLETGADARINADGEYQNELSDALPGASLQAIRGLGDEAQLSEERYKTYSFAQLHILLQNVVITIGYFGSDAGGSMTAGEMRNGAVAAARAVLTALR
jgi:hypothetical protein